jgi:hypothetical protein
MLTNYFQKSKKYFKIRKLLMLENNSITTDKKIKKRISKLNEFEHFSLFCEVFTETSFYPFTKENLSHFTKKRKKTDYKIDDFFPRSNSNTTNSNKDYFLIFNCNKDFQKLIINHLKTKEYSKDTLINKLLIIKDYVLECFLDPLTILIPTLKNQLGKTNKLFIENDTYICDLIEELTQIEEKYIELTNRVENKIHSFSKNIKGNYQIDLKNEILEKLYKELDKFDFIDINKTSKDDFLNVLKLDWSYHNSIIYMRLNNIDFKYFILSFEKYFKNKIYLTFIEEAKNIKTINGDVTAKSIAVSFSKSKQNSENFEIIDSIFEKIKKG